MRRRRGGRRSISAGEVHAAGHASIAAGGDIINPQTYVGEIHVHGPVQELTPEAVMGALANTVDVQWRDEALRVLSLEDPVPMPVRWNLITTPQLGGQIGQVEITGPVSWSGTADDIAGLAGRFKDLSTGRLVIVGGAGAGKTTLAVQLLRRLLAMRKPAEPVPVLLSVSGWDVREHPTFESWLTARLEETYPSLRESAWYPARQLFALRRILPVLDGLDELPEEVRPVVLRLVNQSLDAGSLLVVTSRTREYAEAAAAGQMINGAAVIEAEPLSPDAAADYLAAHLARSLPHPGWRLLIDDLRVCRSAPLAEVLSNPLGLWVLRTAYEATTDPSALLDAERFGTARALRSHLFDRLIPELVRLRRPAAENDAALFRPRRVHDPADVERWLGHLADVLRQSPGQRRVGRVSTGSRTFAWWSLAARVLRYPLPAPVFLLAAMLLGTGWITLIGHQAFGLPTLDSAVLALLVPLLLREDKAPGYWTGHTPGPRLRCGRITRLPGLLVRALPLGLLLFLTTGLFYTAVETYSNGFAEASRMGLRGALLVGLVPVLAHLYDGLAAWTTARPGEGPASTPLISWRADRSAHLVRLLLGASLAGMTGTVAITVIGGTVPQIIFGTLLGLPAGAAYALVSGGHNAWPAYLVATLHLSRRRQMPRKLMPFLDDAHRLGLLRAVGPIYQFRHAQFQDHLAARHLPATRPVPAPIAPVPAPARLPERLAPELLRTFRVPRRLLDVAFNPDGRTLALFRDGSTHLVDLSGRRLRRVRHGLAPLRMLTPSGAVAFSPDGGRCAVTGGTILLWPLGRMVGHARIFEVTTGRESLRLRHPEWVQTLAFSPDGTRLVTGGEDGTARIWDTVSGEQLLVINHTGDISSVAFSPDGTRLATGTYIIRADDADEATTEVWDAATGQALLRLQIDPDRFINITSVAFSLDGALLAAANGWATTVWEAQTGTQILTLATGARQVAFSPDGVHLLTAGPGPYTDLHRLSDGASVLRITHAGFVTRARFSPDGALLLSVGEDRTAQVWRLWPEDVSSGPAAP
ncbi:NACHT domain-containing protein [Streptomyces sp. NPDC059909]|uniref:NACHT and WD40 repeat domain-containing protein n=1 Tax=Streptomyces sp. NPDC059909 TaxID=3346998 RepID=UPI00365C1DC1